MKQSVGFLEYVLVMAVVLLFVWAFVRVIETNIFHEIPYEYIAQSLNDACVRSGVLKPCNTYVLVVMQKHLPVAYMCRTHYRTSEYLFSQCLEDYGISARQLHEDGYNG